MEKPRVSKSRVGTLAKTSCMSCRRLKMKCVATNGQACARCQKAGRRCVFGAVNINTGSGMAPAYAQTAAQTPRAQSQNQVQLVYHHQTQVYNHDHDRLLQRTFTSTPSSHLNSPLISKHPTTWASMPGPGQGLSPVPVPLPGAHFPKLPGHDPTDAFTRSVSMPAVPTVGSYSALNAVTYTPTTSNFASPEQGRSHFTQTSSGPPPLTPRTPISPDHPNAFTVGDKLRNGCFPTDEEMSHLCRFFMTNLLTHIPILADLGMCEYTEMIKKKQRPLACCMVYVAARFVPGCKSIQTMLLPEILAMLNSSQAACDEKTAWTTLQAYAVLYNWASPQDHMSHTDLGEPEPSLKHDALRTSIEALATQHSLHKSAEQVASLLEQTQNEHGVRETFVFRKYLYWLWMFGVAHFRSLVARTPPSIRDDSAIRSGIHLLRNHLNQDHIRRILARVELCLVWSRTGLHDRGLGEWWCAIPNHTDLESGLAVLKHTDEALENWRRTWSPPEQSRSLGDNSLDFHYGFTRFCLSAYVTKLYQSSTAAISSPLLSLNLVTTSVDRAVQICHSFLELSPLSKSATRFTPEDAFAMVALGCEYVICTHRLLLDRDLVNPAHLNTIRALAELLVDLGIDNKHGARVYGEGLLGRLNSPLPGTGLNMIRWNTPQSQAAGLPSEQDEQHLPSTHSTTWMNSNNGSLTPGAFDQRWLLDAVTAIDEVWPMSLPLLLAPETPTPEQWMTASTSKPAGTGAVQQLGLAINSDMPHHGPLIYNYNGPECFGYDQHWAA